MLKKEFLKRSWWVFIVIALIAISYITRDFTLKAEAAQQKVLNLLLWEGYDDREALKPFIKKYNVKINATYISSDSEVFAKLMAAPGIYDIITGGCMAIQTLVDADLLEPIDPKAISNWEKIYPGFRDGYWLKYFGEGKVTGVPFDWGGVPITYNADKVKPKPDSWAVLFDPRYKGKVGLTDDFQAPIFAMAKYLESKIGPYKDILSLTHEQLAEVMKVMRKLKPQVRALPITQGDFISMIESEDIWVGEAGGDVALRAQQDGYLNIHEVVPKEGTMGWCDSLCIPKGSPHRETALAYIDHMISAESQVLFVAHTGYMNVNMDATKLLKSRGIKTSYDPEDVEFVTRVLTFPKPFPTEEDGPYATRADWIKAWEEWKTW